MSLINDALKRAQEAQQDRPPVPLPPLLPMEPRREPQYPQGSLWWFWLSLAAVSVGAIGLWIGLAMPRHKVVKLSPLPA